MNKIINMVDIPYIKENKHIRGEKMKNNILAKMTGQMVQSGKRSIGRSVGSGKRSVGRATQSGKRAVKVKPLY